MIIKSHSLLEVYKQKNSEKICKSRIILTFNTRDRTMNKNMPIRLIAAIMPIIYHLGNLFVKAEITLTPGECMF